MSGPADTGNAAWNGLPSLILSWHTPALFKFLPEHVAIQVFHNLKKMKQKFIIRSAFQHYSSMFCNFLQYKC
jgi:hypothetical protein